MVDRLVWGGKSTLANELEKRLFYRGVHTYLIDGDNLRMGISSDLGFTERHRQENIRRAGELAKVLVDAGIVALISPYQRDRTAARNLVGQDEFIEIYVKCPFEVCANRDPKGLYKKVEQGVITNFTGFDSPYEEPSHPELIIPTDQLSIADGTDQILAYITNRQLLLVKPTNAK